MPDASDNPATDSLQKKVAHFLTGEEKEVFSGFSPADTESLLSFIEDEGVAPLFCHALKQRQAVAENLVDYLKGVEIRHAALHMLRQKENAELFAQLSQAGLDFLLLKGQALALTLYPAPHLRTRCDTDLLFRNKADAEKAWEILENRGYKRHNTLDGRFVGFQFSCTRMLNSTTSNTLDIHNQISDYLWLARRFSFDEIAARGKSIPCGGTPVNVPDRVYGLLHACIHRISNKPQGTENRLIWLYDIHLLCQAMTPEEWNTLLILAKKKSLATICREGIDAATGIFSTEVPGQVRESLGIMAAAEKNAFGMHRQRWMLYLQDFWHNRGITNKAGQIREHLFPSPKYMMAKYQPGRAWHLPYYYAKRLLSGLKKYF